MLLRRRWLDRAITETVLEVQRFTQKNPLGGNFSIQETEWYSKHLYRHAKNHRLFEDRLRATLSEHPRLHVFANSIKLDGDRLELYYREES